MPARQMDSAARRRGGRWRFAPRAAGLRPGDALATLTLLFSVCLAAAPITLDEALAMASRRNPDLAIARLDEEAAATDVRLSYEGVLPRLDLTSGLGHQYNGESELVGGGRSPAFDSGLYDLGLALSWTLFDGLSSWKGIFSARTRERAAQRQYDETTLQISFEVMRRFYEVVRQQRALEVRRETAALSAQLVERADALFSAGRGTKADTYSARVNLNNDRIAVRDQAAIVERARSDLAVILGLTTTAGLDVVPPEAVTAPVIPAPADVPPLPPLQAEARKRRPLLAVRRLGGEANQLEIDRARGAYFPAVGVQASWTRTTPDLSGKFGLFGSLSVQYVAVTQLTFSWNLYAGGSTRAGVQRAEVEARRAWTLLEQAEQSVAAEVDVAREQLASLVDTASTVQENVKTSEAGLRFARERLEAGVGSQLEVRDATLKLSQAKLNLNDTIVDLVVARANLNRAVGGSL